MVFSIQTSGQTKHCHYPIVDYSTSIRYISCCIKNGKRKNAPSALHGYCNTSRLTNRYVETPANTKAQSKTTSSDCVALTGIQVLFVRLQAITPSRLSRPR